MPITDALTWDLDSLLPGGPKGDQAAVSLDRLKTETSALIERADQLGVPGSDPDWQTVLPDLFDLSERAMATFAPLYCYSSAHTTDLDARRRADQAHSLFTRIGRAWTRPDQGIGRCADDAFQALRGAPALAALVPMMDDKRRDAHLLLPAAEQALVSELEDSALHGWGGLYDRTAGDVRVDIDGKQLSDGQAGNLLEHPDPQRRRTVQAAIETAWSGASDTCALALGHITQTRSVLASRRGAEPVDIPLARHRLQRGTLDAMMDFCAEARPLLWRYFAAKARALGQDQLHWADLRAPIGASSADRSWGSAQDFVITHFESFSTDMADFAREAFAGRWVEVEDRPGKGAGAYCMPIPLKRESRIFMTWGGTTRNLLTLAHELGHAYHNHVLWDTHPAQRRVPSTLAETASTFAEALVRGAAQDAARDGDEELALLDEDLSTAAGMLVNIPVRFHFERALYGLRAQGPFAPAALSDAMHQLQRDWYGPILSEGFPLFWAQKLHFYLSGSPFYNYPYTFGYLFSALVHAKAMANGPQWAPAYARLLQSTGSGPAEAVSMQHLGADLEDPAVWRPTLKRIQTRVDRYEQLV